MSICNTSFDTMEKWRLFSFDQVKFILECKIIIKIFQQKLDYIIQTNIMQINVNSQVVQNLDMINII